MGHQSIQGIPGTLDKAIILVVSPLLPDSAIGGLITQQPSTHIGTVPSGCGYNFSCNLHQIDCLPQLRSSTCPGFSTQSYTSPRLIASQNYQTQPVQSIGYLKAPNSHLRPFSGQFQTLPPRKGQELDFGYQRLYITHTILGNFLRKGHSTYLPTPIIIIIIIIIIAIINFVYFSLKNSTTF